MDVRLIDPVRRAFRWHRRGIAALLAAVAVLAALNVAVSRESGGTAVVVATRPVAGGANLQEADLGVVTMPASLVPEGAFTDPAQLVDRTVVVDVPARAVVTSSALLGAEGQVPAGKVALPVRFGEAATVALLRVGNHVDVLGPTDGSGYGVVAGNVRVIAVPARGDPGLLDASRAPLVLLEVSPDQAAAIAAATAVSSLSFALH